MSPEYHTTRDYHLHGLQALGWELTICNALSAEGSPCRKILKKDASYGQLLYAFLDHLIPVRDFRRVLEVGGGYGCLMRDFLSMQPGLEVLMIDLSPVLLEQQRRTLHDYHAAYVQSDFLEVDPSVLKGFDLAILNENLGDFPVLLDISRKAFQAADSAAGPLKRVLEFFERYELARPDHEPFHCNIGAMEVVEKLCTSGIPHIFLSEHSCEAAVSAPHNDYIDIQSSGNPERINLYGHAEYTIAFTHLQKIAEQLGYRSVRGSLADFIEIDYNDRIKFILRTRLQMKDEHEVIRQFVEDLFKYEYLVLSRAT